MWPIPPNNPEGKAFIIVVIIFAVVAVVAFVLRLYSRRLHKASLDASDYTCLLGLTLSLGLVVIIWGAFANGWGQNINEFTFEDAIYASQAFVAIDIVWNAAVVSVRISMLLLYIRIFAVRYFRILCWVLIGLNVATVVSVILATCLICRPITYSFNKSTPGGYCGNLARFELYTAILNLILDSIIVILPMPMLWNLQISVKKKVGLSIALGMGTIICALTLTRVIASIYYEPNNYTKEAALVALITGLEPIAGVINACLPFFPLVFRRIGQTHLFVRASMSFKSLTQGTNKGGSTVKSGILRVNHSGKFRNIEMDPVKVSSVSRGYAGIGSLKSMSESGHWEADYRSQDRILVRNDFSVESEMQ